MNREQFTKGVLHPTLREIPKGYSGQAALVIKMIIAHESARGEFLYQRGGGPALGPIQMERTTHDSTWNYGDSIWDNAVVLGIVTLEQKRHHNHPPAERLIYDLRYNVFMARQRLFMKSEALPETIVEMSAYLKKHWNSADGAADDGSYMRDYLLWD